jgi:hypothetical protein
MSSEAIEPDLRPMSSFEDIKVELKLRDEMTMTSVVTLFALGARPFLIQLQINTHGEGAHKHTPERENKHTQGDTCGSNRAAAVEGRSWGSLITGVSFTAISESDNR